MTRAISVPGNLLLCGEYAITCPRGCGAALALDARLVLSARAAKVFSFCGSAGEQRFGGMGCAQAVLNTLAKKFGIENIIKKIPLALHADSGALYTKDAGKAGYGSSAALAVALTAAFLDRLGLLEGRNDDACRALIAESAAAAHRAYQGGGSGYDVYASTYGGLGLFRQADTGDAYPAWEALPAAGLPQPLFLVRGASPAISKTAVRDFCLWREENPARAFFFLRASNRATCALAAAIRAAAGGGLPSPAFIRALERARRTGLRIGRALGRDPEPIFARESEGEGLGARLEGLRALGFIAKASGAGGELAFAFRAAPAELSPAPACIESARLAETGVEWR